MKKFVRYTITGFCILLGISAGYLLGQTILGASTEIRTDDIMVNRVAIPLLGAALGLMLSELIIYKLNK